jgi:hypothetical protein
MIGRFFAWLWTLARFFPTVAPGIRFGSGASVLLTFLFLVFFLIGLGLVGLGFDLNDVDAWLARQGSTFDLIGTILFKIILLAVLSVCLLVATSPITDRSNKDRPGGCMILVAIAISYLCVVGIFFS